MHSDAPGLDRNTTEYTRNLAEALLVHYALDIIAAKRRQRKGPSEVVRWLDQQCDQRTLTREGDKVLSEFLFVDMEASAIIKEDACLRCLNREPLLFSKKLTICQGDPKRCVPAHAITSSGTA